MTLLTFSNEIDPRSPPHPRETRTLTFREPGPGDRIKKGHGLEGGIIKPDLTTYINYILEIFAKIASVPRSMVEFPTRPETAFNAGK